MVSSEIKKKAFDELLKYRDNLNCVDCSSDGSNYVNVTFGSFICQKCFLVHSSQGFNDSLKQFSSDFEFDELVKISAGGNTALLAYWDYYSLNNKPISYKYGTVAAEYYRNMLEALSRNKECLESFPEQVSGRELSESGFKVLSESIQEVPIHLKKSEKKKRNACRVKLFFSSKLKQNIND